MKLKEYYCCRCGSVIYLLKHVGERTSYTWQCSNNQCLNNTKDKYLIYYRPNWVKTKEELRLYKIEGLLNER